MKKHVNTEDENIFFEDTDIDEVVLRIDQLLWKHRDKQLITAEWYKGHLFLRFFKEEDIKEDKLDPVYKLLQNLENDTYDRQNVKRELITKASVKEIEDRLPTAELSTKEVNGLRMGEGLLVRVGPRMILLKYEGRNF